MGLFTFVLSGDERLRVCRRAVDCGGDNRVRRRGGQTNNYLLCCPFINLTELPPQQDLHCVTTGKSLKMLIKE